MLRGFTLIEVLVALVLVEFGMLALAATTAVAARDLATATRRTRALALATNRVEQLRVSACLAPTSGSAEWPGGLTEFWRVEASGSRRVITDSVEFVVPQRPRSSVIMRTAVLC